MAILSLNLELQDAQGNALSGASIYICTQPANTSVYPPTPLATTYSNSAGTVLAQPILTDGFGQAQPYISSAVAPVTVVYNHPLFAQPLVVVDQYPAGSSTGSSYTPVQASTSAGTITGALNGTNKVFTLPWTPAANSLSLYYNGQQLTLNVGYTLSGAVVTLATAPVTGDNLNANAAL